MGFCLGTKALLLSQILLNFLSMHLNSCHFLRPRLLNLKYQKSGLSRHPFLEAMNTDCLTDGEKDKGESFLLILGSSSCRMPGLSCPILLTCFPLKIVIGKTSYAGRDSEMILLSTLLFTRGQWTVGALCKCF